MRKLFTFEHSEERWNQGMFHSDQVQDRSSFDRSELFPPHARPVAGMAAFEGSMSASSLAVGALEAVHAGREMEAVSSTPICYPIVTCRAQFERRTSEIDLRLLESGGADGDRLDLLSPQRVHKAATILGSGQQKRSGAQEQKQQPDFRISEGPRNRQEDLRYRDRNKRTRRPYTQWDDGTRSKRSVIDKSQLELHPSRSLDSPKVAEISWLKWRMHLN
jgi:hypothetical protein